MSPRYLAGCFLLVFLEGQWSILFSGGDFLHLDPATCNPSVPSRRMASFTIISFWSHWRYFTVLLFLSFFSATLYLSASSLAFSSAFFLAF